MREKKVWKKQPGYLDSLHTSETFPSDNAYGIPLLPHVPSSKTPTWLVPYGTRVRSSSGDLADGAVHFFLYDRHFEHVWVRPHKALHSFQQYQMLLTPDFSMYADWPIAAQLWNTYRNRWIGCFWTSHGFTVIPSISWTTPESYEFAFLGAAPHSLVAVSSLGLGQQGRQAIRLWWDGFFEMISRLQPRRILCHGKLPPHCPSQFSTEVRPYPTRWDTLRQARRAASDNAQTDVDPNALWEEFA